jgi:hypothetical protein
MAYKIKDLDKGFEDFIVNDFVDIQDYIKKLDEDLNVDDFDTFEKAKRFLNSEYNIDVELI